MSSPLALADAAQVVARNIAPVAGILFFGWSARPVLYLYFADTVLAMAVIIAGVIRHLGPVPEDDGWAARLNGEVGAVAGGLFGALIVAVPLAVSLIFMLDGRMEVAATFADPAFRTGLAWQAVAAVWSYATLWGELRHRTIEELRLKRRFALVFLRWMALLIFTYLGVAALAGSHAPLLFVAAYAGISIWAELAPDHFLRTMPGGAEHAPGAAPAPAPEPGKPSRPKGRERKAGR